MLTIGFLSYILSLSHTLKFQMFLSTFVLDETAFELIYYKWPGTLWTIAIESVNTKITALSVSSTLHFQLVQDHNTEQTELGISTTDIKNYFMLHYLVDSSEGQDTTTTAAAYTESLLVSLTTI